jgi:hypothetical protein
LPFECNLQRYTVDSLRTWTTKCKGDDKAGLYKLNAVDPQLERRLVSTLDP